METSIEPATTSDNPTDSPPSISSCSEVETLTTTTRPLMPPPSLADEEPPSTSDEIRGATHTQNSAVPYKIPAWSEAPSHPFLLEVLKDGSIIDQLDVTKKGAYMFGRIDLCDFVLEHPTISRFHAVLQFKGNEEAYLYDLGSTHGTFINKNQVKKKVYVGLRVGDVIRFGLSTRLYIFQGPTDLMPPEAGVSSITYDNDREASLRRAKENAALADGISWGMGEDAIEEAEDDSDEITWQTYKGELTEKQQKTREKVLKRMEKIAHMKKEISAIRAKDIAQGGLTQGQQTQIARNEMRISQIVEELESLEETLNDSIRESLGARTGNSSRGRQKGVIEDEDEFLSDDDDFYDRTIKKSANKAADRQSIETADSLLDKKEILNKEMEEKSRLLLEENSNIPKSEVEQDIGDVLDTFMSGLSSQLVLDRTVQLEKDLSSLQAELDRIVYLLKIADPTGEAAKKRLTTAHELKSCESASSSAAVKRPENPKIELKKVRPKKKPSINSSTTKQATSDVKEGNEAPKPNVNVTEEGSEAPKPNVNVTEEGSEASKPNVNVTEEGSEAPKPNVNVTDSTESKPTVYHAVKPQWLGAVGDRERKESRQETQIDNDDEFVDYKDRKKILDSDTSGQQSGLESDLENAAPGLILRKKKQVEKAKVSDDKPSNPSNMMAEEAVALLLKHKRGLHVSDDDVVLESHDGRDKKLSGQDNKRPRRLGPEKPAFLENSSDYETWVPPKGQSGDGRTSLNDRLGY